MARSFPPLQFGTVVRVGSDNACLRVFTTTEMDLPRIAAGTSLDQAYSDAVSALATSETLPDVLTIVPSGASWPEFQRGNLTFLNHRDVLRKESQRFLRSLALGDVICYRRTERATATLWTTLEMYYGVKLLDLECPVGDTPSSNIELAVGLTVGPIDS